MVFFIVCTFEDSHSAWLSGMLLFDYLVFGSMLLDQRFHAFLLIFVAMRKRHLEDTSVLKPAAAA